MHTHRDVAVRRGIIWQSHPPIASVGPPGKPAKERVRTLSGQAYLAVGKTSYIALQMLQCSDASMLLPCFGALAHHQCHPCKTNRQSLSTVSHALPRSKGQADQINQGTKNPSRSFWPAHSKQFTTTQYGAMTP
jgi:hypothetical protein